MPRPSKADLVFGEIAVKNRLLTKSQVDECLKALEKGERGAKSLAEVVEKRSLLSTRAVAGIGRAQNYRESRLESKLYARIAVKSKFAELKEVRQALAAQKKAYLNGEPPPDLGEMLVNQGAVTTDEDRAIREAIRKLDKESLIGTLASGKASGAAEGSGEELVDVEEGPAAKEGKRGSGRAGKGAKRASGRGAKAGSSRRAKETERPSVEIDDELCTSGREEEPDDVATSERGAALGADGDLPPLGVDTQAIELEDVLAENAGGKNGDEDSSEDSSISDSSSGRAGPAPVDELALDLAGIEPPKRPRAEETHDLMEVVMAPGDLAPIPELEEGAAPAAAAKKRESGSGEKKGAAIEVPPADGSMECPRCNVRIEPNVRECLYCGYKVPGAAKDGSSGRGGAAAVPEAPAAPAVPAARPASGRAAEAAAPAPAPAPATAGGGGAKGLEAELQDATSLGSGCRFDVLRAKDRKRGGAPAIVLALPAGVEPTAEQLAALESDAAAVRKLGLRHVLHLERVGKAGGRTLLVYEDAPGEPATARTRSAPFPRLPAARATRELAAALAETAKAGVFAREVRPEAVFLDESGDSPVPRLAGFGAARLSEPPAAGGLSESGFDAWVPPERTKKADAANARTDLFGVGAFLKLLLSGNAPTGKEPKADLPDAPGGLKTVLVKTLDPASGKRFLDFSKLLEEMERAPGVKGTSVELRR